MAKVASGTPRWRRGIIRLCPKNLPRDLILACCGTIQGTGNAATPDIQLVAFPVGRHSTKGDHPLALSRHPGASLFWPVTVVVVVVVVSGGVLGLSRSFLGARRTPEKKRKKGERPRCGLARVATRGLGPLSEMATWPACWAAKKGAQPQPKATEVGVAWRPRFEKPRVWRQLTPPLSQRALPAPCRAS